MAGLAPPPEDLRGFPRRTLRATVDLYRIHPADLGAWWFSADGHGRFDLEPPAGTCYVAMSALGAFVEVFRDFALVAEDDVAARALSRLRLPADVVLADCTSARARMFGVTAAIHTTPDYDTTRSWAAALRARGFGGIRYFCGHDPSQRQVGVAVFGDGGEPDWAVAATTPVPAAVILGVEREFGLRVLPVP